MSPSEYGPLVEFLGRHFTAIDRRFGNVGRNVIGLREEIVGLRGEMRAHFEEGYRRFDRLELGYQALAQILGRIEAGLAESATGGTYTDPRPPRTAES
jgi:hypothetical protein